MRRYTNKSLLDRVEALEAQVAVLQHHADNQGVWPEWAVEETEPWSSDPWPNYNADKRKGKTNWSHSDGGPMASGRSKEPKDWNPDERIRGQYG